MSGTNNSQYEVIVRQCGQPINIHHANDLDEALAMFKQHTADPAKMVSVVAVVRSNHTFPHPVFAWMNG